MSIFTLLKKKKTGPGHKPRVFNSKATTTPGHAMASSSHSPPPPSPSQPCVLRGCEEMSLCPQSSLRSVPVSRFSGLALLWFLGFALPLPLCFGLHLSSHSALCPDCPLQAKLLFAWSQGHAAVSGWGFIVLFQQFHSHPPASVPSFPGSVRRTSLAPLPSCPCVPLRTPEAGAVPGHQGMERGAAR